MSDFKFNIEITQRSNGLFAASAFGSIGIGSTIKEAIDLWCDVLTNKAIDDYRRKREATKDE